MDALSFAAGLAAGLKSGGGKVNNDPDYALWQTMPEPADNETVFIVRMDSPADVGITTFSRWDEITETNAEFIVNWGDGSTETFPLNWANATSIRHAYDTAGTYTINCISSNTSLIPAWIIPSTLLLMAKYGENIRLESCWTYSPLYQCQYMKYIKIPASTDFSLMDRFFESGLALRLIDYKGPPISIIYDYMFFNCFCLDFANWDFSQVTTVGNSAFSSDERLEVINLPLCTSIGGSAFASCSNLLKITIPSGCEIGRNAFSRCYSLYPIPT